MRPTLSEFNGKWCVRDERGGPCGPSDVTREEAEAWMADPIRVVVAEALRDHVPDFGRRHPLNEAGQRRCACGAEWADNVHHADVIAERLRAVLALSV